MEGHSDQWSQSSDWPNMGRSVTVGTR